MSMAKVAGWSSSPARIDRLRNSVLTNLEVAAGKRSDESARLVLNRGIDEHAGHFRDLGDFEWLQDTASRAVLPRQSVAATVISFALNGFASSHVVAYGGSETVARSTPSTQNCYRLERRAGKRVDLRHDPDDSGFARPSQGRRDSNRQGRGGVGGTGAIGSQCYCDQNDRRERAKLHRRVLHHV
jgi:hypothetical protein